MFKSIPVEEPQQEVFCSPCFGSEFLSTIAHLINYLDVFYLPGISAYKS
jgi:hypothetical protein